MPNNASVDVTFTESGRKKLNNKIYENCIKATIKKLTFKGEALCKEESPKGPTGNLQRGHSSEIKGFEGYILNHEPYVNWIIWGHGSSNHRSSYPAGNIYYFKGKPFESKGIPNNYPQRVVQAIASEKLGSRYFHDELRKKGVLQ